MSRLDDEKGVPPDSCAGMDRQQGYTREPNTRDMVWCPSVGEQAGWAGWMMRKQPLASRAHGRSRAQCEYQRQAADACLGNLHAPVCWIVLLPSERHCAGACLADGLLTTQTKPCGGLPGLWQGPRPPTLAWPKAALSLLQGKSQCCSGQEPVLQWAR